MDYLADRFQMFFVENLNQRTFGSLFICWPTYKLDYFKCNESIMKVFVVICCLGVNGMNHHPPTSDGHPNL